VRSEQQATAHHTVAGEVGGVVLGQGEATSCEEEGEAHLTHDDDGVGLCWRRMEEIMKEMDGNMGGK
jgi:hypothetical protein